MPVDSGFFWVDFKKINWEWEFKTKPFEQYWFKWFMVLYRDCQNKTIFRAFLFDGNSF